MKILPSERDFRRWQRLVPSKGDLLFGGKEDLALLQGLGYPVLRADEAKAMALFAWSLNHRSWYGYTLGKAKFCVWVPKGKIENVDSRIRQSLAEAQIRLGVPTILSKRRGSARLKEKVPMVAGRHWLTSAAWRKLNVGERLEAMRAWFQQNEIFIYESVKHEELPAEAGAELRKIGFHSLLNTYAEISGPNCFAAAAGAIAAKGEGRAVAKQWLHWPSFREFLACRGYRRINHKVPVRGDVLVFYRRDKPVHVAYLLGGGLYFEKPGQDFYEPYRVEKFSEWRKAWPEEKISLWRNA